MKERIVVIAEAGAGAGAGDAEQACGLLRWVGEQFGHDFELVEHTLVPATFRQTMEACRQAAAVLTPIPAGDDGPRSEASALLARLRLELALFSSVRSFQRFAPPAVGPVESRAQARGHSDVLVVSSHGVRPALEPRGGLAEQEEATSALEQDWEQATLRLAFRLARRRWGQVTAVDLEKPGEAQSTRWRARVAETAREFPGIVLERMTSQDVLLHAAGGQLHWDVVLAPSPVAQALLSREALLSGLLGVHPSASLGAERLGLYQPLHGPTSDGARGGSLHAAGATLAVGLLLRYSLGLEREATLVEAAVARALSESAVVRGRSSRAEAPLYQVIQSHLGGESRYSQAV